MSLESLLPTVNTQYVVTYLDAINTLATEFFNDLDSATYRYLELVNDGDCVQLSEFRLMSHTEIMENV